MSSLQQLEISPVFLLDHEEDLVAALKGCELQLLSDELLRSRVISKEAHDRFSLLDHDHVDPGLQARYLVRQVLDMAAEDDTVTSRFLVVLRGLGGESRKVCARVMSSCDGATASGLLSEDDIPVLLEVLIECSFKWEELGIALRLPQHVLEECRNASNNKIKLHRVLVKWVSGQYETSKPADLKAIKGALSSSLVGESNLSNKLHEGLIKPAAALTQALTSDHLKIVYQSNTTTIKDGRAAILEVRVHFKESVCYQWKRNGQPLDEDSEHSGTSNSILYITSVNQRSQGAYMCLVRCGEQTVESDSIQLEVIFPPEKEFLLKKYSYLEEVPADSWPPVSAKTYINLAIIKKDISGRNPALDYTLMGNEDDILDHKEKIDYGDVFGEYSSGTLMLVEGRPGSGKTTLMHKVTRDWAVRASALWGAKLVLLVPLRLLNHNGKHQTIADLLEFCYSGEESRTRVASEIGASGGKAVCFILDGLDEYPMEPQSVVSQLLNRRYPEAMVIVASRHHGTARYRNRANQIVEVLGFEKPQIFKYIDMFPFSMCPNSSSSDRNTAQDLKTYLNNHKNILHMCYIPVHCAMLCYLYTQLRDELPSTETMVYECFTKLLLLRKMAAKNRAARVDSLKVLEGKDKLHFKSICNLAFEMCIKSKQVIHQSELDLPSFQQDDDSVLLSLGLLKVDSVAGMFGCENTYSFHHLTFQEFLAAFHIAELETEQQLTLIKEHCNRYHYLYFGGMLWKFYCGLVNFEDKIDHLAAILNTLATDSLYPIQCAFQSQQQLACDMVMCIYNYQLHVQGHTLTISDINALKFVTTTSSCPLKSLTIKCFHNLFTAEHSQALKDTFQCCKKIQQLNLSSGDVDSAGAQVLSSVLDSCTDLQQFNISKNSIGSAGVIAVSQKLKSCKGLLQVNFLKTDIRLEGIVSLSEAMRCWSNLMVLDLSYNDICSDGVNALPHKDILLPFSHPAFSLLKKLQHCDDIRSLDLSLFSEAGSDGMNALVAGLKHCRRLKVLKLQNIGFGVTDAAALASGLEYCDDLEELDVAYNVPWPFGLRFLCAALIKMGYVRTIKIMHNWIGSPSLGLASLSEVMRSCDLHDLDLSDNEIDFEGAEALANGLRSCRNLKKLDISDNDIRWGAACLAVGLKHCKQLVEFDISNNKIENAAVDLAEGLACCTKLKKVYLHDNDIGAEGGAAIASALSHCSELNILNLNFNCIGSEGAIALGDMLKTCRKMQSLTLGSNSIGNVGTEALSNSLKYCNCIQELFLDSNDINVDGAKALAHGLQYCTCLNKLDLGDNIVGDEGVAALAGGLKYCLSLLHLGLDSNHISSAGAIALADGLHSCSKLGLSLMGNDIGQEGRDVLSKLKITFFITNKEEQKEEDTVSLDENTIALMCSIGAMLGLLDERTMKKLPILPP